jgi:hypothetical protein
MSITSCVPPSSSLTKANKAGLAFMTPRLNRKLANNRRENFENAYI